ncbi:hypothetical protein A3C37_02560 [Candidatus Peribacteria bacterium RIFCSPHIGHO2_02_FULL_53_20]|nr:MAG: hypothetical protein A3C37_02560 [Candidatus Peribacteria bacterium RIFCSPHIGHO2_02_FULL_53_20]OGJ67789.1 MAG: hypothetical protein A3B61_03440 [Candidatus Peribacteria bacterium RIFCSPLOWO2_01_FULL_53_10]OGJ69518.1 MAG: hypothetical protein A3G69_02245 [Candidatus Peribacteria bacterium RIFCSPLOWO2_12_FULL_53_10]
MQCGSELLELWALELFGLEELLELFGTAELLGAEEEGSAEELCMDETDEESALLWEDELELFGAELETTLQAAGAQAM